MKKVILTFALISFFSFAHVAAQVGAPIVYIDFYIGGSYDETNIAIPLRNTVNSYIGVFYNKSNTNNDGLFFQTISTQGTRSGEFLISPDFTGALYMDAAWHPGSKCYLVVYLKNNTAYYGRIVKFYPNSPRPLMLAERFIATYSTGMNTKVAAAKNGKFIVFFIDGHKLSAISLRDDATTFKPLKTITNFNEGSLHLGGAEKDGRLTGAYLLYIPDTGTKAWLRMVKMNNKLKKVKFYNVTGMAKPGQYAAFLGKYDPVNHIHTAIVGDKYCTFKRRGKIEFALANLPTAEPARAICYDPVNECFGLMTVEFYEDPNTFAQGANIYMSTYDYQGTFLTPETFLYGPSGQEGNPRSFNVEFAPNGYYLITYCLEQSGGLNGLYFN